jgi:hypothetical protein
MKIVLILMILNAALFKVLCTISKVPPRSYNEIKDKVRIPMKEHRQLMGAYESTDRIIERRPPAAKETTPSSGRIEERVTNRDSDKKKDEFGELNAALDEMLRSSHKRNQEIEPSDDMADSVAEKCIGNNCAGRHRPQFYPLKPNYSPHNIPNLNMVNGDRIKLPPRLNSFQPRESQHYNYPQNHRYPIICDGDSIAAQNNPSCNMLFRPAIQLAPPIIVPVPVVTPTQVVGFTNYAILTATSTASFTKSVANPILPVSTSIIMTTVTPTTSSLESDALAVSLAIAIIGLILLF